MEESAPDGQKAVDTTIERESGEWNAIDPVVALGAARESVWFIDGVRRLEARVTAKSGDQYFYGAFGAYAVGAVHLNADQAGERFTTGRMLALSSSDLPPGEIPGARPDVSAGSSRRLRAMDKSHQAAVAEESTAQRNLEKLTQEAAAAKNALAAAETEERAAAIRLTLVAGCLSR